MKRIRKKLNRIYNYFYGKYFGLREINVSRITDSLYLGAMFNKEGSKVLKNLGINAVVSMRISLPRLSYFPTTLHIPTPNHHAPDIDNVIEGVHFIDRQMRKGSKVYIHCRAGQGRGPTMAISYLVSKGMDLDDAMQLVRKARPIMDLTDAQIEFLQMNEARLKEEGNPENLKP